MKQIGYVSKVDALGRVVIPKPVREMYNIEKEDAIEVLPKDNGIFIRKYMPTCAFCDEVDDLITFGGQKICYNCIEELSRKL